MTLKRLLVPALLLLALAGCGGEATTDEAGNEGIWVDAGPLDYHIQGSRQLNPNQVPDDRYLQGVPTGIKSPSGSETWFAVFLRIENKTGAKAATSDDFKIEDTEGKVYRPVPLDTKANSFAYQPATLGSGEVMPHPDSTQELDASAGSMLLFKLPLTTIANRPLEFKITAPAGSVKPTEAEVTLDV